MRVKKHIYTEHTMLRQGGGAEENAPSRRRGHEVSLLRLLPAAARLLCPSSSLVAVHGVLGAMRCPGQAGQGITFLEEGGNPRYRYQRWGESS